MKKKKQITKPVKDYNWLLQQDDVFIIISSVYNKEKTIKKLSNDGFIKDKDFAWDPEWYGTAFLPYPLKTWEDNEHRHNFSRLEGPWDYRHKELLTLMPDTFSSVMDCGEGNMSLSRMLSSSISYYPIDRKQKYPETIVCNFNNGSFPDIDVDIIFLCGILEYITCPDIFYVMSVSIVKLSYMTYNSLHLYPDISSRMLLGWKNHFITGDLVKKFCKNNFHLSDEIYEEYGGIYLRFDKNNIKL